MADLLRKIEVRGGSRPLQYAVRDVRGVEPLAAAPTDRTGFNEEAEWTGRADAALNNEHDAEGNHGGLKFPFCVVVVSGELDATVYPPIMRWTIDHGSTLRGVTYRDDPFVSFETASASTVKLAFASPPAFGDVAVHVEGVSRPVIMFPSSTEIEFDTDSLGALRSNGGHWVFSLYEVA